MGVRGWNRFLAEQGWLPPDPAIQRDNNNKSSSAASKASLWMDLATLEQSESSSLLMDRLVIIPAGSELHLDGFALCFHLHSVAYARYRRRFFSTTGRKRKNGAQQWSAWQVRQALPQFLPLSEIEAVAREFVTALHEHRGMQLFVYWDGDKRYAPRPAESTQSPTQSFKHDEELHRQSMRVEEWSNLQQYCLNGRVPADTDSWDRVFPKNRLFITQVMHTLTTMKSSTKPSSLCCTMVFGDEEADALMAQSVRGRQEAYLIGMDSDFCFFPDVQYVPLPTLWLDGDDDDGDDDDDDDANDTGTESNNNSHSELRGIVLQRHILAQSLDLPLESFMIDLATLMGNDYVDDSLLTDLDIPPNLKNAVVFGSDKNKKRKKSHYNRVHAILEYLRDTESDEPVVPSPNSSNQEHVEACLHFVRKLYNLEDMSDYPCQETLASEDTSVIPSVDKQVLDLNTIAVDHENYGDGNVQDAVLRYLQVLMVDPPVKPNVGDDENDNGGNNIDHPSLKIIEQIHIEAFLKFATASEWENNERPTYASVDKKALDKNWRPSWADTPAVYWTERVISKVIQNTLRQNLSKVNKNGSKSIMDEVDSPSAIFDSYLYHFLLLTARESNSVNVDAIAEQTVPDTVSDNKALTEFDPQDSSEPTPRLKLPVDEFEETIVERVRNNRVTIIQGETGCGKSSRIPVMLMRAPPPNPNHRATTLFVSVPRRIAAKALVERLRDVEPDLKDQIALRMGHGVREYETVSTRAWFVTSGYLVRLMANHPERFDSVSILIIDEVHERSVDTDILCLLCRRLLATNPHLRLVLMSATLAAAMYQDYFGVPEPPIKVGARRFPVRDVYLDDLSREIALAPNDAKKVTSLLKECGKLRGVRTPSAQYLEKVHAVVANLATTLGEPGSSVLIFVPGMNDIVAITEHIENIERAGIKFNCVPIHSDIPFEDQMHVFDTARAGEANIILATNAAESSVTLPNVDSVICLGLCKQIVYNEASHRQMLMPTWISRASATQRAGRTGRVRPGTVYRMYSRETYESWMEAFEPGEMLRIPLDSIILMLRQLLTEDAVTDVLESCLEPPNMSTIQRSFESLYTSHFITAPDDSCEITTLGEFVSALGIDLALGSLIGLGIQMGVAAEAIQLAAILSFPKTPWIMSNALVHPTKEFNEQTRKTYVSRCHFDSNLYSEPLAIMNLLWDYEHLHRKKQQDWCWQYGIFPARIKRLMTTAQNLRKRVATFVGIQEDLLNVSKPPSNMSHGMVTTLRVIQVWVFHETMIELDPSKIQKRMSEEGLRISLQPKSDQIELDQLNQVLVKDRHPHALESSTEILQKGSFEYFSKQDAVSVGVEFAERLETHLISYCTEKGADGAWIAFSDSLIIYYRNDSPIEVDFLEIVIGAIRSEESILIAKPFTGKARRGIGERACGLWDVSEAASLSKGNTKITAFLKFQTQGALKKKKVNDVTQRLKQIAKSCPGKLVSFKFPFSFSSLEAHQVVKFEANSFGSTSPIAEIDLRDMLGPSLQTAPPKKLFGAQKIFFPHIQSVPFSNTRNNAMMSGEFVRKENGSSWERPLMECMPEGARLLSVLGTLRRKDVIKLVIDDNDAGCFTFLRAGSKEGDTAKRNDNSTQQGETEENELEICLEKGYNIAFRWNRFNSNDSVIVDANSVPASAIPANGSGKMYCVCANTLELRNGALRAEGLTLLPLGKEFLLLSRISFGLFQESHVEDGSIAAVSVAWAKCAKSRRQMLSERVMLAVTFHLSSVELGESLECFPRKVSELLSIFDDIDGYESRPWDTLDTNPFISHNLNKHQKSFQQGRATRFFHKESSMMDADADSESSECDLSDNGNTDSPSMVLGATIPNTQTPKEQSAPPLSDSEGQEVLQLLERKSSGQELRSARVLGVIARQTRCKLANTAERDYQHTTTDWKIISTEFDSKPWYRAIFNAPDLIYIQRTSNKLPNWMKDDNAAKVRPTSIADAMGCIPTAFEGVIRPRTREMSDSAGLFFDSLKVAVQMEAAFWLERQFTTKKQHWYDLELADSSMTNRLLQEFKAVATRQNRKQQSKKQKKKKNSFKKNKETAISSDNKTEGGTTELKPDSSQRKKKKKNLAKFKAKAANATAKN